MPDDGIVYPVILQFTVIKQDYRLSY